MAFGDVTFVRLIFLQASSEKDFSLLARLPGHAYASPGPPPGMP